MNGASSSHSKIQYPALYLYPINGTWVTKHLTLRSEHTKIGRQTSSKTSPGERNGFFDAKVLSKNHAEVWEDGGMIYIKDVRSSNGTFINGRQLSAESQESEPFELKSDDIVEFGIDIVGEDSKTVVHRKVTARVACIFTEQDAQVAARAEQHQQQQQMQQQYLQHQAGTNGSGGPSSSLGHGPTGSGGPTGPLLVVPGSAGTQSYPFAAQRRVQLAQQSLGGLGGIRPPGKSGLSFDVVLSRLQGELQKSRETAAELNSLTGTMGDIHETLGGNVPPSLPPFPSTLPLVKTSQEAGAPPHVGQPSDFLPEQPVVQASSNLSAAAVEAPRNSQDSVALHLNKLQALEGWIAEQETMKREVSSLREMIEERKKEMEEDRVRVEERIRREVDEVKCGHSLYRDEDSHAARGDAIETRENYEMVDEDDSPDGMDDDDDARSISTVTAHELERVDEEEEEQPAQEEEPNHENVDEFDSVRRLKDVTAETQAVGKDEGQETRQNDLNVGRPKTPEPSRLGLFVSGQRFTTVSSSLTSEHRTSHSTTAPDDVYEQVAELSKQVTQLTSALETQHSVSQSTIKGLEGKLEALEQMWSQDRDRLNKAREGFEAKLKAVDNDLEKVALLQSSLVREHQKIEDRVGKHEQLVNLHSGQSGMRSVHQDLHEEPLRYTGGLVIPPSPRSQSSDSGRYRRRTRRKSPGTKARGRSGSGERAGSESGHPDDAYDDGVDTDSTLASSNEDDMEAKVRALAIATATAAVGSDASAKRIIMPIGTHYATPVPSVGLLEPELRTQVSPVSSKRSPALTSASLKDEPDHAEELPQTNMPKSTDSIATPTINTRAAVGVVLLSIAAAAVFWKVKE